MVGQRWHANIEEARWRRAGVVMDVFVQVATGEITVRGDVAGHRAALRINVNRSIRHGVLPHSLSDKLACKAPVRIYHLPGRGRRL